MFAEPYYFVSLVLNIRSLMQGQRSVMVLALFNGRPLAGAGVAVNNARIGEIDSKRFSNCVKVSRKGDLAVIVTPQEKEIQCRTFTFSARKVKGIVICKFRAKEKDAGKRGTHFVPDLPTVPDGNLPRDLT